MVCEFSPLIECPCTKEGCPRHGKCCACVAHHRAKREFPACFFSAEAEREYNRTFARLMKDRG
jgi:hypothetical protein